MGVYKIGLASFLSYFGLIAQSELHLRKARLGERYLVDDNKIYTIFRETYTKTKSGEHVVLIVGFRLKIIGANRFLHWLFQRCCILTTPFWSGFHGFRIKLWMVESQTKDYLGIYDWASKDAAQVYADTLIKILEPLSVKNSVWYQILPDKTFAHYLAKTKQP